MAALLALPLPAFGGDVSGVAALATDTRVIVVPAGFAALSPRGRDIVMAHELTHLATRHITSPQTAAWLPSDADLAGPRTPQAYQEAWLAVDALVHQCGALQTLEIYRGAGTGLVDLSTCGLSLAAFTESWRTDLLRRLR